MIIHYRTVHVVVQAHEGKWPGMVGSVGSLHMVHDFAYQRSLPHDWIEWT
jgi:hypothetical protein